MVKRLRAWNAPANSIGFTAIAQNDQENNTQEREKCGRVPLFKLHK
jgi:hypothetical protein